MALSISHPPVDELTEAYLTNFMFPVEQNGLLILWLDFQIYRETYSISTIFCICFKRVQIARCCIPICTDCSESLFCQAIMRLASSVATSTKFQVVLKDERIYVKQLLTSLGSDHVWFNISFKCGNLSSRNKKVKWKIDRWPRRDRAPLLARVPLAGVGCRW